MRIVAISDTHGQHRRFDVPEGDVLVHAGDFMGHALDLDAFYDFLDWMADMPHEFKLVVPGNHDGVMAVGDTTSLTSRAADAGIEIESLGRRIYAGVTFGCYSYTPRFCTWHFQNEETRAAERLLRRLPPSDVLVTHGPSYGVLDLNQDEEHCGCTALTEYVRRTRPMVHIHGHIHEAFGHAKSGETDVYCVSSLDGHYRPTRRPVTIDL